MFKKSKVCKNCQYWRVAKQKEFSNLGITVHFCSNSKSDNFQMSVGEGDTCNEFSARGKKAPPWMRIANKILRKVRK